MTMPIVIWIPNTELSYNDTHIVMEAYSVLAATTEHHCSTDYEPSP